MTRLIRDIGMPGAALLTLNGMIGAGIFALPGVIAKEAGVVSPWLFLVVGVLFIAVVLCYAELASYFKESGGPVLYASRAFGPLVAFNTGWVLFVSRMTAFAANANVIVLYLGSVWPWVADGVGRGIFLLLLCGGLTLANIVGVRDGMRTVGVFTFLKLTPLVVLVVLGMQHVGMDHLLPGNLPTIEDLGGTTLLLIYAFVGFESSVFAAGETKRPKRTIPCALVLTITGTAILYFLIELVYVAVLPEGGALEQTLVDAGRVLLGSAGALAITLAAVFSIGGNLAGTMLSVPRLVYSLAEDRLLPAWFGRVHEKFATPHNAILLLGVLAFVFAVSGSFVYLAKASSLARLLSYIVCIAAVPVLRDRVDAAAREQAFRLPGGYLVPLIAMALCIWITAQSSAQAWLLIGGLLVAGLFLYWLEQRTKLT